MARDDITVGGVRLATWRWTPDAVAASGRTFVLVHGLASNAHLWDGVAEHLAGLGHAVVAYDQRGHGRSAKPDNGYDMATVASDLRSLIDHLGLERPVLAGQSWGGNVVVEAAARWPDSCSGLVCIDGGMTHLGAAHPEWETAAETLAPPRFDGTTADEIERHLRSAHPDWPETGIAGALACFETHAGGTVTPWLTRERHMQILRGLWEHEPLALYPRVRVPVLLIPADTGAVPWTANKADAVAGAAAILERVEVEWMAGDHDLHAQHPGLLAERLHRATAELFA